MATRGSQYEEGGFHRITLRLNPAQIRRGGAHRIRAALFEVNNDWNLQSIALDRTRPHHQPARSWRRDSSTEIPDACGGFNRASARPCLGL